MSSRLMNMKFMRRAAENADGSSQNTAATSANPNSQRYRLTSSSSSIGYHSYINSTSFPISSSSMMNDGPWYFSVSPSTFPTGREVDAENPDEDHDARPNDAESDAMKPIYFLDAENNLVLLPNVTGRVSGPLPSTRSVQVVQDNLLSVLSDPESDSASQLSSEPDHTNRGEIDQPSFEFNNGSVVVGFDDESDSMATDTDDFPPDCTSQAEKSLPSVKVRPNSFTPVANSPLKHQRQTNNSLTFDSRRKRKRSSTRSSIGNRDRRRRS